MATVGRSETVAIAVMAKAPQAGRAKTRLVPPLDPAGAAALSAAFLRDITANIALAGRDAPVAGAIAYAPAGTEALLSEVLAPGTFLLLADGSPPMPPRVEGIGRSLLHAVRSLLADGYRGACVVNADSPTLPTEHLRRAAAELLAPGDRIVLGPAEDGGYYLLGVKAPHAALFEDIAWSTAAVAAQTRERARDLGLDIVELPPWYDVDDRASLDRLLEEFRTPPLGAYPAPASAACLARLRISMSGRLLLTPSRKGRGDCTTSPPSPCGRGIGGGVEPHNRPPP
ncbi:MAG TPA: TIGR04282 family arsenosugar biosynthesis glycosyltransferase [Acetobacteraceae bacterium]|nr:TIGR04282 family arsenosugar biosynthesis glycosyltransferase [Acetobacteraceae bacterium]